MPDALAQGATHLVSIGGVQSNHTRQVAAVAAKLGLKARLVQESWVDWPDSVNDRVGNILLSRIMGAEVELVEAGFGIGVQGQLGARARRRPPAGRHAVPDPGRRVRPSPRRARLRRTGPTRSRSRRTRARRLLRHDHRLQRHRVDARRHDRRLRRAGPAPPPRVIGIDASAKLDETRAQVAKIARNTAELIGLGRDLRDDEITVLDGLGRRLLRHPGAVDARRDPAHRQPRGDDHRPGVRGQVDGRADRPGAHRRDRPGLDRALRAPRRPAGAQRLQRAVPV